MKKFVKTKVFRVSMYVLIALLGMAICFAYGTFKPNFYIKDKLKEKYEKSLIAEWNSYGFIEPSIEYKTNIQFITSVGRCIDFLNLHLEPEKRIHRDIIIAMAVLETGYGKSRFATEANNLFGIRTWSKNVPQMKALANPDAVWGVKKYKTKCQSVADVIDILNRHPAYEEFRVERTKQLNSGVINYSKLVNGLKAWSTIDQYSIIILDKIKSLNAKK